MKRRTFLKMAPLAWTTHAFKHQEDGQMKKGFTRIGSHFVWVLLVLLL
jgi:hypothetical protein